MQYTTTVHKNGQNKPIAFLTFYMLQYVSNGQLSTNWAQHLICIWFVFDICKIHPKEPLFPSWPLFRALEIPKPSEERLSLDAQCSRNPPPWIHSWIRWLISPQASWYSSKSSSAQTRNSTSKKMMEHLYSKSRNLSFIIRIHIKLHKHI